jgi:hypothetical protein
MTTDDKEKKTVETAREAFTNDSAFMIAYERAIETETEPTETRLVNDPFARMLAGDKGQDLSDSFGVTMAPKFGLWPDFLQELDRRADQVHR